MNPNVPRPFSIPLSFAVIAFVAAAGCAGDPVAGDPDLGSSADTAMDRPGEDPGGPYDEDDAVTCSHFVATGGADEAGTGATATRVSSTSNSTGSTWTARCWRAL